MASYVLSNTKNRNAIVEKILSKEGKRYVPGIIVDKLGANKWYTGPATMLGKTWLGRRFIANKLMDMTTPQILRDGGALAKQFRAAGGMV